jgi:hypothetical protein
MIFLEDRRFVVVKNYHGHCTCLALHTYNGQGTTKPGVHAQDHAAAYAVGSKLKLKTGEKMDKEPFRIKVEDSKEKIDPMTRINFSKLYTVEHNVRVMKVGRIVDDDLPRLKKYSVSCLSGNNSDPEPAGGTNSRSQEQGQIGQAGPQPMQYPAYSASSAFGSNGSASYTGTPGPVQPPISNWSYSNASSLNQSMVDTGPYPVSDSSLPSYLNAGYTAASYVPPQTTSYKGSAPTYGSRRQSYRDRDNMYDPDL